MMDFSQFWGGSGFGQGPVEQSVQGMLGPNAQFTAPEQPGIWDKLMAAVGQGKPPTMPGTTIGAPAGSAGMAPAAPTPMLPQTQMPPPRGIPNVQALLNPTAAAGGAGNQNLMAQYMALQQLMRGA